MKPHMTEKQERQSLAQKQSGFSLLEVLIAFSILIIAFVSAFQSRLDSTKRIEQTGDSNQIYNRIRSDIAYIRNEALVWKCRDGACSGLMEHQHQPARYENSHCSIDNPFDDFPIKSASLSDENNDTVITRDVVINGKQLDITYSSSKNGKTITSSISIIPQAMNWC